MSNIVCLVCGNKMKLNKRSVNVIVIDDKYAHKKCPKTPMVGEEKEQYVELMERLKHYMIHNPSPRAMENGYSWININQKVKELKAKGYSYKDMTYTLDEVVKKQDNIFWGFGAVVNYIDIAIGRKNMVKKAESSIHIPRTSVFDIKDDKF